MSGARKLQTEIERVMKKVDEGVELFDEIWEKVYSAEQQNQKEKYEMDLKKEIKKLQRLRDQIKTWIGSSEVKDKDSLVDARKLIETKMEQFKICEKETKTKTYSKEGLAREDKLDPAEEAKRKTTKWISEFIDKLNQLVEDRDVEIERLSAGKGKKSNKHIIEEYQKYVTNHKFHINKLEGIMRLVNNDRLDTEVVDTIKEDLEYYLESYEDDDYQQAYDEEFFYEALGLDEMDVVNVDRVTQVTTKEKSTDDVSAASSKSKKEKSSKKSTSSSVIPMTIGRARVTSSGKDDKDKTPSKLGRTSSSVSGNSHGSLGPTPTAPRPAPPPPSHTGGASMAAILKREGEQQEKERQKALQQQQLLREQQARAQAEQLRQQQLQRQQQEAQLRQQEALRQQQAQQKAAQQEALKLQQQLQEQQRQQAAQQEVAAKQQAQQQQQLQAQKAAEQNSAQSVQGQRSLQQPHSDGIDILNYGLSGVSLGNMDGRQETTTPMPTSSVAPQQQVSRSNTLESSYLSALDDSFAHIPTVADSDRHRQYTPRNPYPTPVSYPNTPSPIFDHPAIFEKLGTDCLFFIFYYSQGTYQQYLAARELKKQSWRYHKKYMTWFQRHEEPKVTTDEYEQGTYVYFDYETGWCQRIKADFRFEYSFLEDSLQ